MDAPCYIIKCLNCSSGQPSARERSNGQAEQTERPNEEEQTESFWYQKCCRIDCPGNIRVGRLCEFSDLTVDHVSVSRKHAEIKIDYIESDDEERNKEMHGILKDLNSSNGSFTDGRQVCGEIDFNVSVLPSTSSEQQQYSSGITNTSYDTTSNSRLSNFQLPSTDQKTHLESASKCSAKSPGFRFGQSPDVFHVVRILQNTGERRRLV